jgi:hypothetical protein
VEQNVAHTSGCSTKPTLYLLILQSYIRVCAHARLTGICKCITPVSTVRPEGKKGYIPCIFFFMDEYALFFLLTTNFRFVKPMAVGGDQQKKQLI